MQRQGRQVADDISATCGALVRATQAAEAAPAVFLRSHAGAQEDLRKKMSDAQGVVWWNAAAHKEVHRRLRDVQQRLLVALKALRAYEEDNSPWSSRNSSAGPH